MRTQFYVSFLFLFFLILFDSCSSNSDQAPNSDTIQSQNLELREVDLMDLLGTACTPNNLPWCNGDVIPLEISDHPSYPNCTFTVELELYICDPAFGIQDYHVSDFQILDHDCQEFSDDILDMINSTSQSDFILDFEEGMWNSIETQLIHLAFSESTFNCGQGAFFSINYFRSSCRTLGGYAQGSLFSENSTPQKELYTYAKVACGHRCCERITRVCQEPDGSFNIVTQNHTNFTACTGASFVQDMPEFFYVFGEDCGSACPE